MSVIAIAHFRTNPYGHPARAGTRIRPDTGTQARTITNTEKSDSEKIIRTEKDKHQNHHKNGQKHKIMEEK